MSIYLAHRIPEFNSSSRFDILVAFYRLTFIYVQLLEKTKTMNNLLADKQQKRVENREAVNVWESRQGNFGREPRTNCDCNWQRSRSGPAQSTCGYEKLNYVLWVVKNTTIISIENTTIIHILY